MTDVTPIFDGEYLDKLVSRFDDDVFQSSFNVTQDPDLTQLIQLKLGSMLGYEEWIADTEVGYSTVANLDDSKSASRVFDRWLAYIITAYPHRPIDLNDLFLMSTSALLARRPTELRHVLRLSPISAVIEAASSEEHGWPSQLRETVSRALMLVARQSGRVDVQEARNRIDELRALQKAVEGDWLVEAERPQQSALELLALYHCAQAAIVLADYVLDGTYVGSRGRAVNVGTELRTLLRKSGEYADMSSEPGLMTWTKSVSLIIEKLRSDSIWTNGLNINSKIDQLVKSFSRRDGAILSMLPSQQEALGQNLLDAQREALVLQMPTSSGKTLMAELSILQTLSSYGPAKVVYLTPTRALATQVKRTLSSDFADLDIDVTAAGSAFEEDPFELALLQAASGVVVSTPEKLDLLLRSHPDWFENVRLVIVDEAHLLKDGERGARLELLLANLRREHIHVRLLLLTPFVENAEEVAAWLSEDRGSDVDVSWRPARLIVGLASVKGRLSTKRWEVEWKEPHRASSLTNTVMYFREDEREAFRESTSARTKAICLSKRLRSIGPSLAMFPSSRISAEQSALQMATDKSEIDIERAPPELRVALALALEEYGSDSDLAKCLRKGVAFHHSALSSELRYLVERLAGDGTLDFIAATTTLAQGMNFPVSSVVIHSVHKPRAGPLSPAEFWNIAGRAGRVGLSERGVVVFANSDHRDKWESYTQYLSEKMESAMAEAVFKVREADPVKWSYKQHEGIRPFIQYIGHSVARQGANATASELERLVTASFAGKSRKVRAALLRLARQYLTEIANKSRSFMKVADQTGLASFSFDELYANISNNPVLATAGAAELGRPDGMQHLIDALAKLPELSLALEKGHGDIDTAAVAKVVHRWINGASIKEISTSFPGATEAEKVREAGKYVFAKVSQTVSWGTHAYLRGRAMLSGNEQLLTEEHRMLPAYIQYGVNNPASVLASVLGIPRQLAPRFADLYSERNGELQPEDGDRFKNFLQQGSVELWRDAISGSTLADRVSASDLRSVWRDAQGLKSNSPLSRPRPQP
ncbi:DEAD/DEAH box helicase [Roseibium sp. SCP14]|uniref:DEAD/DEAH box helicase n=1 Tax=Roseibium sp. SCP14 TaxID=3141375 RepID=UPI003334AD49